MVNVLSWTALAIELLIYLLDVVWSGRLFIRQIWELLVAALVLTSVLRRWRVAKGLLIFLAVYGALTVLAWLYGVLEYTRPSERAKFTPTLWLLGPEYLALAATTGWAAILLAKESRMYAQSARTLNESASAPEPDTSSEHGQP